MKRNAIAIAVALAAASFTIGSVDAQMVTPPNKSAPTGVDAKSAGATGKDADGAWSADKFYTTAADSGLTEVELGNLAIEKAEDPKVREFAEMMVKDHSAVNDRLEANAKGVDVELPSAPSAAKQAEIDSLSAKSGSAFDEAYVRQMIAAHEKSIALFEDAAQSGDPRTAEFAKQTLQRLRQHAAHAEQLGSSMQ